VEKLRAYDKFACLADMSRRPSIILSARDIKSLYGLRPQDHDHDTTLDNPLELQFMEELSSCIDKNIFLRVEKIFLPVYASDSHVYNLCVIYPSARRIEVVNSYYQSQLQSVVLLMLVTQCDLWGGVFDASQWTFTNMNLSQQSSKEEDSGIVTIRNIDMLLDNLDPKTENVDGLRLFYASILYLKKSMPYKIINRTKAMDEVEEKVVYQVYDIIQNDHRDQELESLIVNLYNSYEINYVYFENMASASTVWNVDVMLKRYRYEFIIYLFLYLLILY
jgi:hypothetical protein